MFAHLHVHSVYSFLDSTTSVTTYLQKAAEFGMTAMALTDHNCLSGAVEFHKAALELGIKPIQGVEITIEGGYHLTLLAQNNKGYQNICQLLTSAFQIDRKQPIVPWEKLAAYHQGLLVLTGCRRSAIWQALLSNQPQLALKHLKRLVAIFGRENTYLEMINTFLPKTGLVLKAIAQLGEYAKVPVVATNDVHYLEKTDFCLYDLLVCTRTQTQLADIHPERPLNAENYFAPPQEMVQRFQQYPQAIAAAEEICERCEVSLPLGRNLFPRFQVPAGFGSTGQLLHHLVWQGARERYGKITPEIRQRLDHELNIIEQLDVIDYFLVVWDIVAYARRHRIRCAGRGSAADSAVAYCLGITNVDSIGRNLLFERFLSLEQARKPDIDVDFDAAMRDQIADYVYQKYGSGHVASVCTFVTYHARSALRDLGKAFGFSEQEIKQLNRHIPHYVPADGIHKVLTVLPELKNHPLKQKQFATLLDLCGRLANVPRHMGTHLGGMVVSGPLLTTVTPLQPSAKGVLITQFDKDTIERLGLIKLDLLSLRTLSAVHDVDTALQAEQNFSYDRIPLDDQATYQMLNDGDTVGVFQLESPAQRSLQLRLLADNIEDIVASVALIRPGPIKGDMVEPFIARRHGLAPVSYIHPKLEPILKGTYGVVLYQEQVIEIATEIAGFTPGESDQLRRVMSKYRSQKEMDQIGELFIAKATANGISKDVAETIFSYIVGYAGYGFCEAHAAAFADTAYKTAYLLKHYPARFYAAILNNQPMGFYPPNTICVEARRRGITILPLDINLSEAGFSADDRTIRIGLKQVKGMETKFIDHILSRRRDKPFASLADFVFRTNINKDVIENLILAGAFDQLNPNRRALMWQLPNYLGSRQRSLFLLEPEWEPVPDFSPWQRWLNEFRVLGLSATTHVMDFFRLRLQKQKFFTSQEIGSLAQGAKVKIAGLVIRPHRPPTRSGKIVVFLTLEDEFGLIDVTVFENTYHRYGEKMFKHPLLIIEGEVARRGGNEASIVANRIQTLTQAQPW
ncbi:MAG: DNA polymerase III subunit alpha [Firmicutes bacterium]|nr:DNA polymerase III subunit alpha [Bacillota bacterium]